MAADSSPSYSSTIKHGSKPAAFSATARQSRRTPSVLRCLAASFHWPEGLISMGLILAVLAVLILFVFRIGRDGGGEYDSARKLTYADSGSYGTAGFMSDRELRETLWVTEVQSTDAIILGRREKKAVCLPTDSRLNRNFAIYGASGSGKSRAFVRNMVLQAVRRGGIGHHHRSKIRAVRGHGSLPLHERLHRPGL